MKHVIDQKRSKQMPIRTKRFIALERQMMRHPNAMQVVKRPSAVRGQRLRQFLRIERGLTS